MEKFQPNVNYYSKLVDSYTSSDEFDFKKRVQITNEMPPQDLYDLTHSCIKNDLWKWFFGSSLISYNIAYNEDTDGAETTDSEGYIENYSIAKYVNGIRAKDYGPVPEKKWNPNYKEDYAEYLSYLTDAEKAESTATEEDFKYKIDYSKKYHRMEMTGTILPETDLMLHEIYRYLGTIYPDSPKYMKLLTENEFNDDIVQAGAIINYIPDNIYLSWLADNLDYENRTDDAITEEAAKLKIRNLVGNSFREKFYGSKSGYKQFFSDIMQHVSILPVAEYIPLKQIEMTDDEKEKQNKKSVDLKWERELESEPSDLDDRTIDKNNPIYKKLFRIIDFDNSTYDFENRYKEPAKFYGTAYPTPYSKYDLYEYPLERAIDNTDLAEGDTVSSLNLTMADEFKAGQDIKINGQKKDWASGSYIDSYISYITQEKYIKAGVDLINNKFIVNAEDNGVTHIMIDSPVEPLYTKMEIWPSNEHILNAIVSYDNDEDVVKNWPDEYYESLKIANPDITKEEALEKYKKAYPYKIRIHDSDNDLVSSYNSLFDAGTTFLESYDKLHEIVYNADNHIESRIKDKGYKLRDSKVAKFTINPYQNGCLYMAPEQFLTTFEDNINVKLNVSDWYDSNKKIKDWSDMPDTSIDYGTTNISDDGFIKEGDFIDILQDGKRFISEVLGITGAYAQFVVDEDYVKSSELLSRNADIDDDDTSKYGLLMNLSINNLEAPNRKVIVFGHPTLNIKNNENKETSTVADVYFRINAIPRRKNHEQLDFVYGDDFTKIADSKYEALRGLVGSKSSNDYYNGLCSDIDSVNSLYEKVEKIFSNYENYFGVIRYDEFFDESIFTLNDYIKSISGNFSYRDILGSEMSKEKVDFTDYKAVYDDVNSKIKACGDFLNLKYSSMEDIYNWILSDNRDTLYNAEKYDAVIICRKMLESLNDGYAELYDNSNFTALKSKTTELLEKNEYNSISLATRLNGLISTIYSFLNDTASSLNSRLSDIGEKKSTLQESYEWLLAKVNEYAIDLKNVTDSCDALKSSLSSSYTPLYDSTLFDEMESEAEKFMKRYDADDSFINEYTGYIDNYKSLLENKNKSVLESLNKLNPAYFIKDGFTIKDFYNWYQSLTRDSKMKSEVESLKPSFEDINEKIAATDNVFENEMNVSALDESISSFLSDSGFSSVSSLKSYSDISIKDVYSSSEKEYIKNSLASLKAFRAVCKETMDSSTAWYDKAYPNGLDKFAKLELGYVEDSYDSLVSLIDSFESGLSSKSNYYNDSLFTSLCKAYSEFSKYADVRINVDSLTEAYSSLNKSFSSLKNAFSTEISTGFTNVELLFDDYYDFYNSIIKECAALIDDKDGLISIVDSISNLFNSDTKYNDVINSCLSLIKDAKVSYIKYVNTFVSYLNEIDDVYSGKISEINSILKDGIAALKVEYGLVKEAFNKIYNKYFTDEYFDWCKKEIAIQDSFYSSYVEDSYDDKALIAYKSTLINCDDELFNKMLPNRAFLLSPLPDDLFMKDADAVLEDSSYSLLTGQDEYEGIFEPAINSFKDLMVYSKIEMLGESGLLNHWTDEGTEAWNFGSLNTASLVETHYDSDLKEYVTKDVFDTSVVYDFIDDYFKHESSDKFVELHSDKIEDTYAKNMNYKKSAYSYFDINDKINSLMNLNDDEYKFAYADPNFLETFLIDENKNNVEGEEQRFSAIKIYSNVEDGSEYIYFDTEESRYRMNYLSTGDKLVGKGVEDDTYITEINSKNNYIVVSKELNKTGKFYIKYLSKIQYMPDDISENFFKYRYDLSKNKLAVAGSIFDNLDDIQNYTVNPPIDLAQYKENFVTALQEQENFRKNFNEKVKDLYSSTGKIAIPSTYDNEGELFVDISAYFTYYKDGYLYNQKTTDYVKEYLEDLSRVSDNVNIGPSLNVYSEKNNLGISFKKINWTGIPAYVKIGTGSIENPTTNIGEELFTIKLGEYEVSKDIKYNDVDYTLIQFSAIKRFIEGDTKIITESISTEDKEIDFTLDNKDLVLGTFNSIIKLPINFTTPAEDGTIISLTEDYIYPDDDNYKLYTYNSNKKVYIPQAENSYFKNIINDVAEYNIASELSSSGIEEKYYLGSVDGFNFDYSKMTLLDELIGISSVNIRSAYDSSLEPIMFSKYYTLNGTVRGINAADLSKLNVSYDDATGTDLYVNKSNFLAKINNILPVDGDGNEWTGKYVKFGESKWSGDSTPIAAPVSQSTTVYNKLSDDENSLKYFKNLLVLEGSIDMQNPEIVNFTSSKSQNALSKISIGDSIVDIVPLTNIDDNYQDIGTDDVVKFIDWKNNSFIVVTNTTIKAYNVSSISSLKETLSKDENAKLDISDGVDSMMWDADKVLWYIESNKNLYTLKSNIISGKASLTLSQISDTDNIGIDINSYQTVAYDSSSFILLRDLSLANLGSSSIINNIYELCNNNTVKNSTESVSLISSGNLAVNDDSYLRFDVTIGSTSEKKNISYTTNDKNINLFTYDDELGRWTYTNLDSFKCLLYQTGIEESLKLYVCDENYLGEQFKERYSELKGSNPYAISGLLWKLPRPLNTEKTALIVLSDSSSTLSLTSTVECSFTYSAYRYTTNSTLELSDISSYNNFYTVDSANKKLLASNYKGYEAIIEGGNLFIKSPNALWTEKNGSYSKKSDVTDEFYWKFAKLPSLRDINYELFNNKTVDEAYAIVEAQRKLMASSNTESSEWLTWITNNPVLSYSTCDAAFSSEVGEFVSLSGISLVSDAYKKYPCLNSNGSIKYSIAQAAVDALNAGSSDALKKQVYMNYLRDYYNLILGCNRFVDFSSNIKEIKFTEKALAIVTNDFDILTLPLDYTYSRDDIENYNNWNISSLDESLEYTRIGSSSNTSSTYYYDENGNKNEIKYSNSLDKLYTINSYYSNGNAQVYAGYFERNDNFNTYLENLKDINSNLYDTIVDLVPSGTNKTQFLMYSTDYGKTFTRYDLSSIDSSLSKDAESQVISLYKTVGKLNAIIKSDTSYKKAQFYLTEETDTVSLSPTNSLVSFSTNGTPAFEKFDTPRILNGRYNYVLSTTESEFIIEAPSISDYVPSKVTATSSSSITTDASISASEEENIVKVLISIETYIDIEQPTDYYENKESYYDCFENLSIKYLLSEDSEYSADRIFSINELNGTDSQNESSFVSLAADTDHSVFEYTTSVDQNGDTVYTKVNMVNKDGNPVYLCNVTGDYLLKRNTTNVITDKDIIGNKNIIYSNNFEIMAKISDDAQFLSKNTDFTSLVGENPKVAYISYDSDIPYSLISTDSISDWLSKISGEQLMKWSDGLDTNKYKEYGNGYVLDKESNTILLATELRISMLLSIPYKYNLGATKFTNRKMLIADNKLSDIDDYPINSIYLGEKGYGGFLNNSKDDITGLDSEAWLDTELKNSKGESVYLSDSYGEILKDSSGNLIALKTPKYSSFKELINSLGRKSKTVTEYTGVKIESLSDNKIYISKIDGLADGSYINIKIMPVNQITLDTSVMNNSDYFCSIPLSKLSLFGYDRVYINEDAFLAPPFEYDGEWINSGNMSQYSINQWQNKYDSNVYLCDEYGNYTKYNGSSYLIIGDTNGDCSSEIYQFTDVRINPLELLYKSSYDYFKAKYYISGKKCNPFLKYVSIKEIFDNGFKDKCEIFKYVKDNSSYIKEEDDSGLVYVTKVDGDKFFVNHKNGIVRFNLKKNSTQKETNSLAGIEYNNPLAGDTSNINLTMDMIYSSYIDSTENVANKDLPAVENITEVGIFNANDDLMAYISHPVIQYDTRENHISYNIIVKE